MNKILNVGIMMLMALGFILLGYFTPRESFIQYFTIYSILFLGAFLIYKTGSLSFNNKLFAAIGFRLLLLVMIPNLSDDIFRFIWDGRVSLSGMNPYLWLPSEIVGEQHLLTNELYNHLNSPEYYTVYPSVCQFIFVFAEYIAGGNTGVSMIVMRLFIISAEVLTLLLLPGLLKSFGVNQNFSLGYALNPLVIIELTGNLHFEGIMILFILLFIRSIFTKQYINAGIFLGIAVSIKLIPLIFIPVLLRYIGWRKVVIVATVCISITGISFLPYFDVNLIKHISSSISLYFQSFEFNASIYYIARWIGFQLSGYNEIAIIGRILPLIFLLILILISNPFKKDLFIKYPEKLLLLLSAYYFLSTTVHPWYLCVLIFVSSFTEYKYVVVWSLLAGLSYYRYIDAELKEPYLLIGIEYILVLGLMVYEFYKNPLERLLNQNSQKLTIDS